MIYIIITHNLVQGDVREHNELICIYTMFSLCWLLTLLRHVSNEGQAHLLMFPPLLLDHYCCFFQLQPGQELGLPGLELGLPGLELGLPGLSPPHTLFLGWSLVVLDPGNFQYSVRSNKNRC
jgi:hypothetical protein